MYSVIERGVFIKLFRKSLLACIVAGVLVMPAHAATSSEIKQQIDAVIEKQNLAHQIAEYVRSFGEDDSNPAIQFAQENGQSKESILIPLYEQYNKAVQEENGKDVTLADLGSPTIVLVLSVMEDIQALRLALH